MIVPAHSGDSGPVGLRVCSICPLFLIFHRPIFGRFCYYEKMEVEVTDAEFDRLITKAMDELPQEYLRGLKNVAIVMADEPTLEQREKMQIREDNYLLGLYEGVPLTQRGSGWSGMLPDKITLFKNQILAVSHSEEAFFEQIKRTLWHEIAHYYGLDHDRMDYLQNRD